MSFSYDNQRLIEELLEGDETPRKRSKCEKYLFNDSLWRGDTESRVHRISAHIVHINRIINTARSILVDLKKEILDDSDSINLHVLDRFMEMRSIFQQIEFMSRDLSSRSLWPLSYQKIEKYIDNEKSNDSISRINHEIKQKIDTIKEEDFAIEIAKDLSRLTSCVTRLLVNNVSDNTLDNSYKDLIIDFKKEVRELFNIKNSLNKLIDSYDIKEVIQEFNRNKQELNSLYGQFLKEVEIQESLATQFEDLLNKESIGSVIDKLKKKIIQENCSWIHLDNSIHKSICIFKDMTVLLIDNKGEIKTGINQEEVFGILMNAIKSTTVSEFKQTPRTAALLNKLIDQHPSELIGFCTLKGVLLEEKQQLKNAGFDLFECAKNKMKDNDYHIYHSTFFESINDHATALKEIYNKKQYAHSISSQKYQHLYNEESYRLLAMLYDEKVSIDLLQDAVGKKMASFKNTDDFNSHIKSFYEKTKGFHLDIIKEKAIKSGVSVVSEQDNLLILKIDKFEHSNLLGSSSWCISTSRGYFDSYTDNRDQYFFFDFNKESSDKYSMMGFTLEKNNTLYAAHSRFDEVVNDDNPTLKACQKIIAESKQVTKLKHPIKYDL